MQDAGGCGPQAEEGNSCFLGKQGAADEPSSADTGEAARVCHKSAERRCVRLCLLDLDEVHLRQLVGVAEQHLEEDDQGAEGGGRGLCRLLQEEEQDLQEVVPQVWAH